MMPKNVEIMGIVLCAHWIPELTNDLAQRRDDPGRSVRWSAGLADTLRDKRIRRGITDGLDRKVDIELRPVQMVVSGPFDYG